MKETTILAIVALAACVLGAASAEAPRRGEKALKAVDGDVASLVQVMKESRAMRGKIIGDLSLEDRPPSFYRVHGKLDEETLKAVGDAIQRAVEESGRYPGKTPEGTGPTVSYLEKAAVILVTRAYPDLVVSEKEERSDLTVKFWLCPNRLTALALQWLRRGGSVPPAEANADDIEIRNGAYALLVQSDLPGELTYRFSEAFLYNAPLEKGNPRAGGDRIGFLRDSVLVEASTWTYLRLEPSRELRWGGMMGGCWREVHALLRSLDRFIKASDAK